MFFQQSKAPSPFHELSLLLTSQSHFELDLLQQNHQTVFNTSQETLLDTKQDKTSEKATGSCILNIYPSHMLKGYTEHTKAASSVTNLK